MSPTEGGGVRLETGEVPLASRLLSATGLAHDMDEDLVLPDSQQVHMVSSRLSPNSLSLTLTLSGREPIELTPEEWAVVQTAAAAYGPMFGIAADLIAKRVEQSGWPLKRVLTDAESSSDKVLWSAAHIYALLGGEAMKNFVEMAPYY